MKPLKILVIDDEKLIRWSFEKKLGAKGHNIFTAETGEEGIKLFETHYPEVVFVDNHLPGIDGIDVIPIIKELNEEVCIIFMTAYESVDVAVEAMKKGAFEYIRKPFTFDEIFSVINNISEKINIKNELLLLRRQQKEEITFDNIIHQSAAMKQIVQISKKIARTDATTILLLGESGTGKDVFARAIHNDSNRKTRPFVTINCSSLPETLLESELFGHEKGAFTDAKNLKKGLFEIADGGTVFLDEIGEINQATQIKLLGVLENRTILRLGRTKEIPVDVRIIAATNKNIKESIENKTFREDLYYRLQIFQIEIPPLSKRKEDITPLLDFFIAMFNDMFRKKIKSIDPDARKLLEHYNWPGNVRELRNVVERAVILQSGSTLQVSSLPGEINNIQPLKNNSTGYFFNFPEEGIVLDDVEKQIIMQALQMSNYNQTKASKLLGVSRDTLRYKQKKYKL
ncbi:MAG: sigma-54-dependent Fis family transcriptional regulator [Draconibacterium sp.]|nr:sigma-54-dependent Fis family transcriptional regulator [Draconibacterium sp.]